MRFKYHERNPSYEKIIEWIQNAKAMLEKRKKKDVPEEMLTYDGCPSTNGNFIFSLIFQNPCFQRRFTKFIGYKCSLNKTLLFLCWGHAKSGLNVFYEHFNTFQQLMPQKTPSNCAAPSIFNIIYDNIFV